MIKTALKLFLSIIVYTIMFLIGNAILPFSPEFRELGTLTGSMQLFILINSAWVCFTIYFIIRNTKYNGIKLFVNLLFIMFFVQCFMTQIETLFFTYAFPVLTKLDIVFIMIASLFPLLATVPLLMKFFQNKDNMIDPIKINIKNILVKLGIIGIIYLFVYMIFGYFVAWQFEELRVFYSGTTGKLSFFGQLHNNVMTNPVIYPFQVLRGILFGAFVLPLIKMIIKSKFIFITSVCLVYLCTGIMLIIPNVLFLDIVRIGHFIEVTSSMLFFGIIVGNVLWKDNKFI